MGSEVTDRPPRWRSHLLRALFGTGLAVLLLLGPGVRLLPFAPGFEVARDGKNRVFYSSVLESQVQRATDDLRRAEREVMSFWGNSSEEGFPFGLDLYLCATVCWRWRGQEPQRSVRSSRSASASC